MAKDRLRLWVDPLRKTTQVACCDAPKKSSSRQLSAFELILYGKPLKRPAAMTRKRAAPDSLRLLVNPLQKKPLQSSEIYLGKMFMPVRFRLPFPTDREAPQVACCDAPKKCSSGLPSAFGRSPAKSPSSLRRFTPEKCLRPSAFGCLFPPTAKLPKQPAATTRKSTAPDSLWLWGETPQKVPPAFGDVPRKNVHARRPSALG